jgi:DNA-binding CsgD family transcriptional regulator
MKTDHTPLSLVGQLPLDNIKSANSEDFIDLFVNLLSFSQTLDRCTEGINENLCQEVKHLTEGRACLFLHDQWSSTDQHVLPPAAVSFQVRFYQRTYGTLQIASDSADSGSPALPLPIAYLLAQLCGLLLHTLELSALIEGQSRRLDRRPVYSCLTKREQEVLKLICQGNTQQEISTMLHIAPATFETYRKRLCQKLGAHCERDIPLAAYQARLLTLLE